MVIASRRNGALGWRKDAAGKYQIQSVSMVEVAPNVNIS